MPQRGYGLLPRITEAATLGFRPMPRWGIEDGLSIFSGMIRDWRLAADVVDGLHTENQ